MSRQRTLLDEINHRVKNALGTAPRSPARRASSKDAEQYAVAFEGRPFGAREAFFRTQSRRDLPPRAQPIARSRRLAEGRDGNSSWHSKRSNPKLNLSA
jgi:hypothetical protein